ncbi:MAG: HU family DNA-binding protein [Bacteroidaceae bacterium]
MAIKVEWQVKPPGKSEERPQMFPRIIDGEIVDEQQLAERIAAHGTLSRGNAKAALNDLAEVMARLLREGKTVSIPMLGSFKLSIGSDAAIHPDSDRRMQRVVVRGVNFQPAQEFMDAIGKPVFQWKPTTGVAIAPSAAQLVPRLAEYFETHDSISRAELERVFGLKRTTAYIRLKELEEMKVIRAVGNGKETVYVSRKRETV